MNLVQLANDLEYVPKEQLAEMSQDPNAHYPPYLVLAEIQRRTQNEKAYAAAQPQPTTTVAEEVVSEFMQPQGLQAGMPPESAPTDIFSSGMSGMPASAPMQQPMQMASGGRTGYLKGGQGTTSASPPSKINQAMYGLENMASSYVNPYSGQIRSGLDAVGMMGVGDKVVNPNALNFLNNANNTLDRVVSGTVGALIPGGNTPFRDMLKRRRARQSSGQEAYDENVEALSRSDERSDRASGGSTSYFEGGVTDLTDEEYYSGGLRDMNQRLRNQSRIDAVETSAQLAETEGLDAAGQPLMSSQLVNQNLEPDEMEMGMAGGGLTAYAAGDRTALSSSFDDPYSNVGGAFGTTGNPIDKNTENKIVEFVKENPWATGLNAAALIALVTPLPGGRIASGALAGLSKAVQYGPKAFKGLRALYNKGLSKLGAGQARKDIAGGKLLPEFSSGTRNVPTPPNFYQNLGRNRLSDMRLGQRALGAGTLATGVGYAYNEMNENNTDIDTEKKQEDLNEYILNRENKEKERLAKIKEEIANAAKKEGGLNLAQLGGIIMGARNMSELGSGIAGLAGNMQERRAGKKLSGLQERYLQAQTEKIEADIASMPLQDALATVKQIDLFFKAIDEGSRDATQEQILEAEQLRQFLMQKISKEQGYDPSMIAGNNQNVIASYT